MISDTIKISDYEHVISTMAYEMEARGEPSAPTARVMCTPPPSQRPEQWQAVADACEAVAAQRADLPKRRPDGYDSAGNVRPTGYDPRRFSDAELADPTRHSKRKFQ